MTANLDAQAPSSRDDAPPAPSSSEHAPSRQPTPPRDASPPDAHRAHSPQPDRPDLSPRNDADRARSPLAADPQRQHPPNAQPTNRADAHANDDRAAQDLINLFVRNVAKHVTEQQLVHLFSKFGSVDSAVVVRDPHSKECRGFGFVKMLTEQGAKDAIEGLREYEFEGRLIAVEKAKRKAPHSRTPGAYMGVDRRIRDRYAGMKRSRDYPPMDRPPYPYPYAERDPHRAPPYRGRFDEDAAGRYMHRPWDARHSTRVPYPDRERNPIRRRYETEDPHHPIDPEGEQRLREREPPVPRESADDVI